MGFSLKVRLDGVGAHGHRLSYSKVKRVRFCGLALSALAKAQYKQVARSCSLTLKHLLLVAWRPLASLPLLTPGLNLRCHTPSLFMHECVLYSSYVLAPQSNCPCTCWSQIALPPCYVPFIVASFSHYLKLGTTRCCNILVLPINLPLPLISHVIHPTDSSSQNLLTSAIQPTAPLKRRGSLTLIQHTCSSSPITCLPWAIQA